MKKLLIKINDNIINIGACAWLLLAVLGWIMGIPKVLFLLYLIMANLMALSCQLEKIYNKLK
ncbi:hypothetical protein [Clostridium estertheticum]|uniref:hypothetical protein n=1 Tax=Clostridium estertheticum TaxID=238834 RepID=UPI001CF1A86C|nr:hypothetical protein [Clostridium estertheticum]MCB2340881.1 hypothetical protein [Clostridium estertheticum]